VFRAIQFWVLFDPLSFGGFLRRLGGGATTDNVAVLIPNFRHIGAPPKFHLFGPSAVYARSLDLRFHHKGNSDAVM
jgi:hypothetical protein